MTLTLALQAKLPLVPIVQSRSVGNVVQLSAILSNTQ